MLRYFVLRKSFRPCSDELELSNPAYGQLFDGFFGNTDFIMSASGIAKVRAAVRAFFDAIVTTND